MDYYKLQLNKKRLHISNQFSNCNQDEQTNKLDGLPGPLHTVDTIGPELWKTLQGQPTK